VGEPVQEPLEETKFDVAVVGAGYGGLVAAAILCRAGRRVIVVDEPPEPGGSCSSVWADDMYTPFGYATSSDTSDLFFFMARHNRFGALAADKAHVALALEGPFDPVMRVHVRDTGDVTALGGPFTEYATKVLGIPEHLLVEFRSAWRDLVSIDSDKALDVPLSAWMAEHLPPELRDGFVNLANIFSALPPDEISAGRFARSLATPIEIYYPNDPTAPGISGITEPYAEVVRASGGRFAMGQKVIEIHFDGRQVTGLTMQDGVSRIRTVQADAVVFARLPDGLEHVVDHTWLGDAFVDGARRLRANDCDIAVEVNVLTRMPTRRSDGQLDDYPSWNRILKESKRLYGGGWWFPSLTSRSLAPGKEVLEIGHMSPGLRPYSSVADARSTIASVWDYLREFYADLDDVVENKGFFIHRAPNCDEWRFAIAPRLPIVVPGVTGLFHVSAAADVSGVVHDIDANAAMQVVDQILSKGGRT
jgi:phytoene dehydrogenase-like protein